MLNIQIQIPSADKLGQVTWILETACTYIFEGDTKV